MKMKLQESYTEDGSHILYYNSHTLTADKDENAYLSGTNDNPYYEGRYIDENGTVYHARWDITDEWKNAIKEYNEHDCDDDFRSPLLDDEYNACEWDNPYYIEESD